LTEEFSRQLPVAANPESEQCHPQVDIEVATRAGVDQISPAARQVSAAIRADFVAHAPACTRLPGKNQARCREPA
jgi:hypothetical protein